MSTVLFAEYLPYVKSTNLVVQIKSGSESDTSLSIAESGKSIVLQHHGQEHRIWLRSPVDEQHDAQLLPSPPASLKISRLTSAATSPRPSTTAEQNQIIWTADQLSPDSTFLCSAQTVDGNDCNAAILDGEELKSFKDLPSEGWAEMMDLWHCHKPEEHHDHEQSDGKGYSASSRLVARSGLGYVDTLTILVTGEDCSNISTSGQNASSVACTRCNSPLGEMDPLCEGIRLFKPRLKHLGRHGSAVVAEQHKLSAWLASYLLSVIDSSGIRRFQGRYNDFTIWIFSPLVYYSLSSRATGHAQAAIKIFYRDELLQPRAQSTALNSRNLASEELTLHRALEDALVEELRLANSLLPDHARRFQDWNVALLDRFSGE